MTQTRKPSSAFIFELKRENSRYLDEIKKKLKLNEIIDYEELIRTGSVKLRVESKGRNEEKVASKRSVGLNARYRGAFSLYKAYKYYQSLNSQLDYLLSHELETIEWIRNDYKSICDKLYDKGAVITPEFEIKLNHFAKIVKIFPSLVLVMLNEVEPVDKDVESALQNASLWNPPGPTPEDFNFDPNLQQCIHPESRYIVNDSAYWIKQHGTSMKEYDPRKVNGLMFLRLSDQCRWGNMWTQILSLIFYKDVTNEDIALQNLPFTDLRTTPRYGMDLVCVKAIASLLRRYKTLPYYTTDRGSLTINDFCNAEFPTSLPTLLSSLLELSVLECGHDIRGDVLKGAISFRAKAAYHSFGTFMLNNKGGYSDIIKLLLDDAKSHVRYRYGDRKCQTFEITVERNFSEMWYDDEEKKKLEGQLKRLDPPFVTFINYIRGLLQTCTPSQASELVRYGIMASTIYCNPGIYYKTSLLLEAEASILPKVNAAINTPPPLEIVVESSTSYVLKYDWAKGDPLLEEMVKMYKDELGKMSEKLTSMNFMNYFVDMLTNRSQGIKVSLEDIGVSGSDTTVRGKLFAQLSNARLIAFLLDQKVYSELTEFIAALKQDGLCTIRYQNNRRARVVEIVPNSEQIAYSPVLYVFERLKKKWSEIAVGKQKGGAIDMLQQLYATGTPRIINNLSDVSGMDASTQPFIGKMFEQALLEWFHDNEAQPGRYFACGDANLTVKGVGDELKYDSKRVHGIVRAMAYILNTKNAGKNYILKDGYFAKELKILNTFFESGRFDTSAQHTVLLSLISRIMHNTYNKLHPLDPVDYHALEFGDDSYKTYQLNTNTDKEHELVKEMVDIEISLLRKIGFKIDIFLSRSFADFLQQSAVYGVVVPKPARSATYCDERGDTRTRDPVAGIKVMANVLKSAAQRSYAIDNVNVLIRSIWLMMRVILIRTHTAFQISIIEKLSSSSMWTGLIFCIGNQYWLLLPQVLIHLPPINVGNNMWVDLEKKVLLRYRSVTSIEGSFGWVWLVNSLLEGSDWGNLTEVFTEKPETVRTRSMGILDEWLVRPMDVIQDGKKLESFHIKQALTLLNYSRSAILSKNRREEIEADIGLLTKRADGYKSAHKIEESRLASMLLYEQFQVRIPRGLSYADQSERKIEQAIAAANEMANELPILDVELLNFLIYWKDRIPKNVQDNLDRFCIKYNFSESEPFYNDNYMPHTYDEFPSLPGYLKGTSYGNLAGVIGSGLETGGLTTKLFDEHQGAAGKYDMETAIQVGLRLKAMSNDAYALYKRALGFSGEQQIEFDRMIERNSLVQQNYDYSSAFSPAQYFNIAGTVTRVVNSYKINCTVPGKMKPVFNLLTRDLLFANIETFNFKKFIYTPSSYTYKYYMLPLRNRLGHLNQQSKMG